MQTIDTAPKDGTHVYLWSEQAGKYLMCWDAQLKKWVGHAFTPMGARKVYWDVSEGAPTHWQPFTIIEGHAKT